MFEGEAAGFERVVVVFLDLDDVPFDGPDTIDRGKDGFEIDRAATDLGLILEMEGADAAALFADELSGILTANLHPIDIGLAPEVARCRRIEHPIEDATSLDHREFGRVVVKGELDAVGAEGTADDAQFLADSLAG